MAEENSIKNQIAAMEGWAIKTKQNADSGKYIEAHELLGKINVQGRKLEWKGGRMGLRHLPDLVEVKVLKKKITEARAAVPAPMSAIEHLRKLAKIEGKKPVEMAAIKKKENGYKQETGKSITILIQVLKEASLISKNEPWINPKALVKPENKEILFEFLRGEKYYKVLTAEERFRLIGDIEFTSMDFHWADLHEASFRGAANTRGVELISVNFERANLCRADLSGADLSGAGLHGVNFRGVNLRGANFRGAYLDRANFSETNVTKEQLHSGYNWETAENIPKELL